MDQLKKTHCRSPGTVGTYSLSGRPHRPRYRHPRQRRSLRTVSNGHTTEYPEWLTCFRPVIPILSDRQATRRRPPNEPAKNRQMKLTVTAYSRRAARCVNGYTLVDSGWLSTRRWKTNCLKKCNRIQPNNSNAERVTLFAPPKDSFRKVAT